MHYHGKARQYFRVLSGVLSMEMDGNVFTVNPGEGIEIAPNIPHQAFNNGDGDCVFLVISAPSTKGDRHDVEVQRDVQSCPSRNSVKS
jgi:mannose-6-phosphate isomerase-like protein (cupin superfamily)